MQTRLLIVLESDAFKAASITNDQGSPMPVDEIELARILPSFNAAALADNDRLKAEIVKLQEDHKAVFASLESAHAAAIAKMQEEHAATLAAATSTEQPAAHISKLTLMHRLNALGKWPAFKLLLTHLPEIVQDAWHLAQSISPTDPLFADAAPQIKAALDLTDEQFVTLLIPSE